MRVSFLMHSYIINYAGSDVFSGYPVLLVFKHETSFHVFNQNKRQSSHQNKIQFPEDLSQTQ